MVVLDKKNILLELDESSKEDAIYAIINQMAKNGYVNSDYANDVLEREKSYPTGLPTEDVFVALPHAKSENVIKTGVGIARMKNAVEFHCMGNDEETLQVELVFVLASPDSDETHLEDLQQLMEGFCRVGLLTDLKNAKTVEEFASIFENIEQYAEA